MKKLFLKKQLLKKLFLKKQFLKIFYPLIVMMSAVLIVTCSQEGPDAFTVTENPELIIPDDVRLPEPENDKIDTSYENAQNKVKEIIFGK